MVVGVVAVGIVLPWCITVVDDAAVVVVKITDVGGPISIEVVVCTTVIGVVGLVVSGTVVAATVVGVVVAGSVGKVVVPYPVVDVVVA